MGEQFLGNNPQDMQDLITKINNAVNQIRDAMNQIEGKVNNVQWNGSDATRFKTVQWPESKTSLTTIISNLEGVAQLVTKQKTEQEQTSAN